MTAKKRTKTKHSYQQRVIKFSQARGKTIVEAELAVSPDYCRIELRFDDKTALSLNLESGLCILPELLDWKTGNYKLLKRWRPVRSK